MSLMRLPRFYCYEGGAPGGIGGVGTSGPGSAAGIGGGGGGGGSRGGSRGGGYSPGGSMGPPGTPGHAGMDSGPTSGGGGGGGPDSAAINAELDAFFGEIDTASAGLTGETSTTAGKVIGTIAGILGFLATGSVSASTAFGELVAKGVNSVSAMSAISSVQSGVDPAAAAGGIADSMGGADGNRQEFLNQVSANLKKQETKYDPQSDDFWKQFVQEWQGAKKSLQDQQKFRQEKLSPAFDTYKQRLSGLSQESTFKPITVGLGDFSTSFLPKRASQNAKQLLANELARTDVMDPEKANLSYLDRLMGIAQFQQELKNRISIAKEGNKQPDDSGTWLDAIGDVMKIGSSGADIYDKIWG